MTQTLKAAIIGCGRIGTYTRPELLAEMHAGFLPYNHAEAIRAQTEITLAALCDIDPANLSRASSQHGVSKVFTDYQELLAGIRPEIISIATRTPVKAEIVQCAVKSGVRGIHVEKPLANSLGSTKHLLELAKSGNVRLSYGTTRRYMDIFRHAKKMIDSGKLGRLLHLEVRSGRTQLLWNHPHSVDTLLFLNGGVGPEFVQASCTMNTHEHSALVIEEDPIVDHAHIKFQNGVTGSITSLPGIDVVAYGSEATLTVAADARWIEVSRTTVIGKEAKREVERIEVVPQMSGTQRAFSELAGAVQRGDALGISPADIEHGQEILLMIAYSSLMEGKRITSAQLPEDFTVLGKTSGLSA